MNPFFQTQITWKWKSFQIKICMTANAGTDRNMTPTYQLNKVSWKKFRRWLKSSFWICPEEKYQSMHNNPPHSTHCSQLSCGWYIVKKHDMPNIHRINQTVITPSPLKSGWYVLQRNPIKTKVNLLFLFNTVLHSLNNYIFYIKVLRNCFLPLSVHTRITFIK